MNDSGSTGSAGFAVVGPLFSRTWHLAVLLLLLVSVPAGSQPQLLQETVTGLEQQLDARIGVAVLDTHTGRTWAYRGDERFPLSSTFKTLACASLLAAVDKGHVQLDRVVRFDATTLVDYSPVTESYADSHGMTLDQLCEAAVTVSDNTAGNLVLEAIGGPQGLTRFLRSTGDPVTRLERWETALNEGVPGDQRDTTSPLAMVNLLQVLLLGDGLSPGSQNQLQQWLRGNRVGDALLRAGVPASWQVGDKTGAGGHGSRSVAAILWPPAGAPVLAAIYLTETDASFADRNSAIARLGQAIAAYIGR